MTEKPLVSIGCLTYNHAPYIRQCIEGFLMQKTDFPFEIIINDDCSTDGTTEIIKEYERRHLNLINAIYHSENQYSKGIRGFFTKYVFPEARGKYIAMCEGDDYWTDPLKLQKQVDFLEAHEDYALCFHSARIKNETLTTPSIACENIEEKTYSADEIMSQWLIATGSVIFRREILSIKLKNQDKILYGDLILQLQSATYGKLYGMKEPMSVYRIHQGGITQDHRFNNSKIKKFPDHYKFIKENFPIVSKEIINQYLGQSYFLRVRVVDKIYTPIFWTDLFKAIYYNPIFMFDRLRQIKNIKNSWLHKG